jgi:very-short-patch-repair endonuclease
MSTLSCYNPPIISQCKSCFHFMFNFRYLISSNLQTCCFCDPLFKYKKVCKNLSCQICDKNRFSHQSSSIYYSIINDTNSNFIHFQAKTSYLFSCPQCSTTHFCNINNLQTHSICQSKTKASSFCEFKFIQFLLKQNIIFTHQQTFPFSGNFKYDFFFSANNLVIELDGKEHFYRKTFLNDQQKTKLLLKNGISLIRITNNCSLNVSLSFITKCFEIISSQLTPIIIYGSPDYLSSRLQFLPGIHIHIEENVQNILKRKLCQMISIVEKRNKTKLKRKNNSFLQKCKNTQNIQQINI